MKPTTSIHGAFYKNYTDLVAQTSLSDALLNSVSNSFDFLDSIPEEKGNYRYAEGKWSIKELLQHIIDTERIFSYPSYAVGLNVYEAERCVNNLSGGKSEIEPYAGYLGRDALTRLLESGGDGLRIYPSNVELDGRTYRSMTFGAVSSKNGSVQDISNTYLQAMNPCPIDCGGDGEMNYLWNSGKD
jgi:hypothetical protein